MNTMASTWQQSAAPPTRARIRAVVADFDAMRRRAIHSAILNEPAFDVIAETGSSDECRRIVGEEIPELVICSAAFISEQKVPEQPFPLFITIGNCSITADRFVCSIEEPFSHLRITEALSTATSRILTIKAGELSRLIRQYVMHSDVAPTRQAKFYVQHEGQPVALNTEQIHWIRAARNYLKIGTDTGVYEFRESMRHAAARLNRCGFVRIHRGAIVNSAAIRFQIVENGVPLSVVLADGTQVQVGPNFRGQIPEGTPIFPVVVAS
jgi:two-component system LytT family response regulator